MQHHLRGAKPRQAHAPGRCRSGPPARSGAPAAPRASPASAAAATAVTPPPIKASLQAMPALSSARSASARTPQGGASVASGSFSPRRQCKARRGEPAEFVLGQFFAAAPAAFLAHDHGIELRRHRRRRAVRAKNRSSPRAPAAATPRCSRSISGTSSGPAAWSLMPSDNCCRDRRCAATARGHAPRSARGRDRGTPRPRRSAAPRAASVRPGACRASASSRCSFMLTAACVVPSASAARVKLCIRPPAGRPARSGYRARSCHHHDRYH